MSIADYFRGKKILITGATGLMGKTLVQKILRSCQDVSTIYIVIRPKKGTSIQDRWSQITELPLFDKLKSEQPNALEKVKVLGGESTKHEFGINKEYLEELFENVNIIYHVAASVSFTEELVSAVLLNIRSTYSMLELAKKMKNLQCFVHTSTAYSNVEKVDELVEERVYDSPLDWKVLLKLVEHPSSDELSSIQPRIMSGHGTTYTLTKRVAESMVEEYSQHFPVVIMRPSLVIATIEDPFPGWIDSHNAMSLLSDVVRQGVVRVSNSRRDTSLQFIALDLSIKAFLIATWNVHRKHWLEIDELIPHHLRGYIHFRTLLLFSVVRRVYRFAPFNIKEYKHNSSLDFELAMYDVIDSGFPTCTIGGQTWRVVGDSALDPLCLSLRECKLPQFSSDLNYYNGGMIRGVDVYCTNMAHGLDGIQLTWSDVNKYGNRACEEYPSERQIWYPFCILVETPFLMSITYFFLQVIPALFGDAIAVATGRQPQFFKLTTRFYKVLTSTVSEFTSRNFLFSTVNYHNLDEILLPEDRDTFSLDQSKLNAFNIFQLNVLGMVTYILKEDLSPDKLKYRKERHHKFMLAHISLSVGVIALACYAASFFCRALMAQLF